MKKIRTANSTLREWGLDKAEDAMRLEDEKDDLEKYKDKEIDSLNGTISDLKDEISYMRYEIIELNDKLEMVEV